MQFKRVDAFEGPNGKMFTREEVILTEVECALGKLGTGDSNLTPGIAKALLGEKRKDFIRLLSAVDDAAAFQSIIDGPAV